MTEKKWTPPSWIPPKCDVCGAPAIESSDGFPLYECGAGTRPCPRTPEILKGLREEINSLHNVIDGKKRELTIQMFEHRRDIATVTKRLEEARELVQGVGGVFNGVKGEWYQRAQAFLQAADLAIPIWQSLDGVYVLLRGGWVIGVVEPPRAPLVYYRASKKLEGEAVGVTFEETLEAARAWVESESP